MGIRERQKEERGKGRGESEKGNCRKKMENEKRKCAIGLEELQKERINGK